jgi:hypothetical protein
MTSSELKVGKMHDYAENRGWGHDLNFRPIGDGEKATASGWGYGIEEGDFLMLANKHSPDGRTKYRVDAIRYEWNPRDMWHADLSYVRRWWCDDCGAEVADPATHVCANADIPFSDPQERGNP